MTIEKYFHSIHNLLEHHWAVSEKQITQESFTKNSGEIRGRVILLDDSFISFFEEVFLEKKSVVKVRYSYQYVKGSEVFRYDNYKRHPGISSPYHHKHTSKGAIQLESAPKLVDVIAEAARYIFA
jgi:hypothetical protein